MEYRGREISEDEIIAEVDLRLAYQLVKLLLCIAIIWALFLKFGSAAVINLTTPNFVIQPSRIDGQQVPPEQTPALVYHKQIPTYLI
jgi:hypothetical protein